jgi:hypothetical protein
MKAHEFLDNASKHLIDRGKQYEVKEGERNMDCTVKAFNAVTGKDLTTEQGWLFMVMLKSVRSQQGEFKADSYEDGAAYFALMGEQASNDKTSPELENLINQDLINTNPPARFYCDTCKKLIIHEVEFFYTQYNGDKKTHYHGDCFKNINSH